MKLKRFNTAKSCQEYAESITHDRCEVSYLLLKHQPARDWMQNNRFISGFDIHHIHGRPLPVECNYWSNLIRVTKAAHAWCHDVWPKAFELCCWLAKAEKHQHVVEWLRMSGRPIPSVENYDFHEETLNRVVMPFSTFCGRVEYLTSECHGTVFEGYGRKILTLAEEFRGNV